MILKENLLYTVGMLMLACVQNVCAATVVYEETGFVTGNATHVNSFYVSISGTYKASLADFNFGNAFDSLSLSVYSGTDGGASKTILSSVGDDLFYATPGLYYASFTGGLSDPRSIGLYALQVKLMDAGSVQAPAPVPLPSAIFLFASALASTGLWIRKKYVF